MPRFFIEHSQIHGAEAIIDDAAHIKALRLRPGDALTLCDGRGTDYDCRLLSLERGSARAEVVSSSPSEEPDTALRVYLAYAKGERLEYAVQKCVELGAAGFTLFPSARCVSRPDEKSLRGKLARLTAISKSAAEQSGRGIIPEVTAAATFEDAVREAATAELPVFPYEEERGRGLRALLNEFPAYKTVSVLTGAEGGFTPEEAAFAEQCGMKTVTLGKRVLRCDTAPVAVAAMILIER